MCSSFSRSISAITLSIHYSDHTYALAFRNVYFESRRCWFYYVHHWPLTEHVPSSSTLLILVTATPSVTNIYTRLVVWRVLFCRQSNEIWFTLPLPTKVFLSCWSWKRLHPESIHLPTWGMGFHTKLWITRNDKPLILKICWIYHAITRT